MELLESTRFNAMMIIIDFIIKMTYSILLSLSL